MLFLGLYTRALSCAAAVGCLALAVPSSATDGAWQADGWHEASNTQPRSSRTIPAPTRISPALSIVKTFAEDAMAPDTIRFTQPGRDTWLADCRSKLPKASDRSSNLANQPDACETFLEAHNAQYMRSVQNWVNDTVYAADEARIASNDAKPANSVAATQTQHVAARSVQYVYEAVAPTASALVAAPQVSALSGTRVSLRNYGFRHE